MKRRAQGQTWEGETFKSLDLSSTLAFGSKWDGCTFESCDLTKAEFPTAKFNNCIFYDCDLLAASFQATQMHHVIFENCRAKHSVFAGATPLDDVRFLNCQLHYSTFYDSTVNSMRFADTNLHGADLRYIECREPVVYDGVVLWGAQTAFGCQFWNGQFDERSVNLFLALVARKHQDVDKRKMLEEMAGATNVGIVERLMGERDLVEA